MPPENYNNFFKPCTQFAFCLIMFETLHHNHPAWYIVLYTMLCLLFFMAIVVTIVFLLRRPLKRHKKYDLNVFQQLRPLHTPLNNRIMQAITFLGKHQFLIPANLILITVFFFLSSHHWYAFNILLVSLSSLLMMLLLKQIFRRNRPETPLLFAAKGMSFPSGHAMMSLCFYGLLLQIFMQYPFTHGVQVMVCISCIILILLIGFSRVYLQVHYVSDVFAGFVIGAAWLYIAINIFNRLENVT